MERDTWEKDLSCATVCSRCQAPLRPSDRRILSMYDHQPVCLACKQAEEKGADYETVSRRVVEECMERTEEALCDPGGYCFYHFYPFTCTES